MPKLLLTIRGQAVEEHEDGSVQFTAGMTIDADGSPRAYGPRGTQPLDYLANAGYPGNWWGIVTVAGAPHVQGAGDPRPGYYVSTTSYERARFARTDPRRYLDSETVPFVVIPGPLRRMVKGIVLGCRARVVDRETGREIEALVGDIGPATHLGEASIAVARAFGLNPNPKHGGTGERRFRYTLWPGQPVTLQGETFALLGA